MGVLTINYSQIRKQLKANRPAEWHGWTTGKKAAWTRKHRLTLDIKRDPAATATVEQPSRIIEREPEPNITRQHRQFPTLLTAVRARLNVWLSGPAGSGKTTAAENVAHTLTLSFYFCGAQSNEYGLLGFTDATGKLVRTPFREAFEHGGVFLFDEVDASHPSALLAFNAALANGHCAFPDGTVPKHKDFVAIAAANTFGLGGTNEYVGRMKQDAAFLDRFIFLNWEVDTDLERVIAGNDAWVDRVQEIRSRVVAKQIKVLITPRASIYGARLLAAGMRQPEVERLVLRKAMDDAQWNSISR